MTTQHHGPRRPSRFWLLSFRVAYRFLRWIDPVLRVWWRRGLPGLDAVVDVEVIGRQSGRLRALLLTELVVDGVRYLGHPNGPAQWTRNLDAAGQLAVRRRDGRREAYHAIRLHADPERERVIRATWSQQPFPGNVLYWLARDHVRAVGVYYRLVPQDRA